ncbi:MAG: alpha/beta hydrolase domain-containing protein [Pseudomonadota bacterium]|nr:alpha/beta hydrolase domain-containing protein [Pseudomonadota bacterium]
MRLPNALTPLCGWLVRLLCVVPCFILCWLPAPLLAAVLTPIPYDAGIKQRPFITSTLDLAAYGYVEEEFIMSGTGHYYEADGRWRRDGQWNVAIEAERDYATRLLVRRPAEAEQFNGIVVVEWFNNTAFMDVDVIWAQSHDELLREGYAWVGVSAQFFGVSMLKSWDRERYGTLRLPNDGLSYDIFSQAGRAVKQQSAQLLGGLTVNGVIGAGESQSAIRLTTYVNAFQADAVEVYDAMLLYSRFFSAAPLKAGITLAAPSRAFIRDDNQLKILQFETEQDVFMFLFRLVRQDDTDFLRSWELPGASHYDEYGVSTLLPQYQRDFPALSNIALDCRNDLNQVPQHYVVNAALSHLRRWVLTGEAPPQSPRIEYQRWQVVRDDHGNATGGIRLPELEVPTATHNYANYGALGSAGNFLVNSFACPFLGNTVPFTQEKLKTLYPSQQDYVMQYIAAADAARAAGFLLPADYEEAVAKARAFDLPW